METENHEAIDSDQLAENLNLLDQKAVTLSVEDLLTGKDRALQEEALKLATDYLENNPATPEINRALFMLYHHGAGVDKELTRRTYEQFLDGNRRPTPEYAKAYLEAERKGKEYLDAYVSTSNPDDFSVLQDQANWHRRVAYYAKYSGNEELRQHNLAKALELHQRLKDHDQAFSDVIEEIHKEQE